MADAYNILGFDMYDISGPQAWSLDHGLTGNDKVAGNMVSPPQVDEPYSVTVWGPLGAWDRSRGINESDVLSGPHHGGHHGAGGRRGGYVYPVAYYPADTYEVVNVDGLTPDCRGIRLKNGRCITSDEILSGFMRGREYISGPRMRALQCASVGGVSKGNTLKPGDMLGRDTELRTSNGGRFVMQTDGNLVLYTPGGAALWSSRTAGKPATHARIESDGTLRLVGNDGKEYYRTTPRSKAVRIVFQDDGNLVWYDASNRAVLDTKTSSWKDHKDGGIISDIGSAVHAVTHAAAAVYKAVDNVASKIPILGTPLHAALDLTAGNAVHAVDAVANGDNVVKVAVSSMKDALTSANTIGQYASVVTSAIPGLGAITAGATSALAAANAISQGKPIDAALINAVKNAAISAVPGGAIAQKVASEAFEIGKSLANGERIDHIALDRARANVPAAMRPAFDAGLAVAQGKKIQDVLVKGVAGMAGPQIAKLASDGASLMAFSAPLRQAALALSGEARTGFQTATALLAHTGVPAGAVTALRNRLPAAQRAGFDKAVAAHAKAFDAFRRV